MENDYFRALYQVCIYTYNNRHNYTPYTQLYTIYTIIHHIHNYTLKTPIYDTHTYCHPQHQLRTYHEVLDVCNMYHNNRHNYTD
jgi:hypothetical protein